MLFSFSVPSSNGTEGSGLPASPPVSNFVPLLSITPSDEIVFTKNSLGDLTAKVQIKNISNKTIAFKVSLLTPQPYPEGIVQRYSGDPKTGHVRISNG